MSQQDAKSRNNITQSGGIGSKNTQIINITETHVDIQRSPSILGKLVAALSSSEEVIKAASIQDQDEFKIYEIGTKLDHNEVIKYRELINLLAEYHGLVESGYSSVTGERPRARQSIYAAINLKYLELVGELIQINDIDPKDSSQRLLLIRENSDLIIEGCINYIIDICKNSKEAADLFAEDIEIHSRYIAFHAFTECKILEKP